MKVKYTNLLLLFSAGVNFVLYVNTFLKIIAGGASLTNVICVAGNLWAIGICLNAVEIGKEIMRMEQVTPEQMFAMSKADLQETTRLLHHDPELGEKLLTTSCPTCKALLWFKPGHAYCFNPRCADWLREIPYAEVRGEA